MVQCGHGVVGWRRQPAGRKRRAPARLALRDFRAVAGGALIRIDLASCAMMSADATAVDAVPA